MSHPDESMPSPPAPLEASEAPSAAGVSEPEAPTRSPRPGEASALESPMTSGAPSGAPYRVQPPPDPTPELPWARPSRPVIGPALSVFAALLWSFVVAGQFTTSWSTGAPLGQGAAVALVLLATLAAWITSVRRSRIVMPPLRTINLVGRGIGIAALALVLFLLCLFAATVAGNTSSRNHDVLIALVLVALSAASAIGGPRLTSPTRPERTHGQRFALVVLWITCVLLTLVAGADLVANG